MRIAFWTIARRAQERAHSLNTKLLFTESSIPATKHCSAFSRLPVNKYESKYSPAMPSVNNFRKSSLVAYSAAIEGLLRFVHSRFTFVLDRLPHSSALSGSHWSNNSCFCVLVVGSHAW